MGSQHYSSYRTECLGALLAISADGPCNIGIDNASCIKSCKHLWHLAVHAPIDQDVDSKAIRQAQRYRCKGQLRKPWGLQPDGGLWNITWDAILTRGPRAQTLTKAKGHATKEDVKNDVV